MQYVNWPQYVGLPQNKGLTTEQIRQRYMWYLNEQTILVESVVNPTSTAAAAAGGGGSIEGSIEDIITNCYKYLYIETDSADFSDWTIDGYTIFTGEPGIYDLPPGLNAIETDPDGKQALYLWSINNITDQSLTIYNPDSRNTQSYSMKQVACETSTTAIRTFKDITSPSTTFFTTLDITDDSLSPITINLNMQSATFNVIGEVSKKLTSITKQIFGDQADCVFEFKGSYRVNFTNIYVGAPTITLKAEDASGIKYQLNIT
jgi:hypothetical protein